MLIGLVGGSCCGKKSIAEILVKSFGFKKLGISSSAASSSPVDAPVVDDEMLCFPSPRALIDYITPRWKENFVTWNISQAKALEVYRRRPFFLLISVEAPILTRFQRYTQRHSATITEFVQKSDDEIFGKADQEPLCQLSTQADLNLFNDFESLEALEQHILELKLTDPERLRPCWDTYFMHLADLAARRANCMKRRVGCILVRDFQILATGYNGTPRGLRNCHEGGCERCNQGLGRGEALHLCLCLHAEENALLEAGRERIRGADWCILYCNTCPCIGCAKKIIQAGVNEVVYSRAYAMDELSAQLFKEAGVKFRQHAPIRMRLELQGWPNESRMDVG